MDINQIKPYEKNAKIHDKKQLALLAKVIKEVGWRQNVEVNQDGVIVAGHGRWLVWQEYKNELPPIWIVDDTGKTIHGEHATTPLSEEQEKMWRLADNNINAMTGFNMDLVIEDLKLLNQGMIDLTGFSLGLEGENFYTKKITTPIYEPKNQKPALETLFDKTRAEELILLIKNSKLPDKEKEFLIFSAYRLIVFRYDYIADYYSHSDVELKNLMEKLALVIIDFNKAIELGFVKASRELLDLEDKE